MKKQFTIKYKLILDTLLMIILFINGVLSIFFENSTLIYFRYVWDIFTIFILIFTLNFKGIDDELSKAILSKINKHSIKFLFLTIGLFGVLAMSPRTSYIFKSINIYGLIIILILLICAILRLALYIYYDKKGMYD